MTGDLLAAIARRLLRDETFALIASPAIADLQFEHDSSGLFRRTRHYVAAWIAIVGGLRRDVSRDVGQAFGADARRIAWPRALEGSLVALALLTADMWWRSSAAFGDHHLGADGALLLLVLVFPFAVAATAPLTLFGLGSVLATLQGASSRRTALTCAAVLFLPTALLSYVVLPRVDVGFVDAHRASVLRDASGERTPLWTVWSAHQREIESARGGRGEERLGRGAERTAYSASGFACALFGLAARERRRLRVMLWLAALMGTQSLLHGFVTPATVALSPVSTAWMITLLLTAAGACALRLRSSETY